MNHLTANIEETRQVLEHQIRTLWSNPDQAVNVAPVMLWGPPGVGKSSVIRDLCADLGIGFIDIRLAQREPVDLRGLPVPEGDQVRWLLSSEWPRDPASRGIVLFDELTAADRTLQVAAYEFILDRRLGDLYRVPPGWMVCAAGNRSGDRAAAMTLSSALANRFCHLELRADLDPWCHWAIRRALHPDVIAFLRFRPECFFRMEGDLERGWPSPRSWERVALTVEHGASLSETALALIVHGLVGRGAGTEFLAFRKLAGEVPDVTRLLRGDLVVKLPERADQRYALCAALAHHVWRAPEAERKDWMTNFLRIGMQLPSDFAVMAMMDAMQQLEDDQDPDRVRLLFESQAYEGWRERHGSVMAHQFPHAVTDEDGARTRAVANADAGELARALAAAGT